MGQKVNPHGLRVGVIKNWDSRWYEKDEKFGDTLVSDYNIRKYILEKYKGAGIPKVEIERDASRIRVFIYCAKPGSLIGKGATEIEKLKTVVEKMAGKPASVNVIEIRQPDLNAQLVAESIASQIERRIGFRRAMKQAIARTMRLGAKGIKIMCSGRLGGAEIARSEQYHEGTIPLQTLRADIEYGFAEAHTTYGKIGIKVWIFKGEVLPDVKKKFATLRTDMNAGGRPDRRDRKPGERRGDRRDGDRRGGFNRGQNNGQNRGQGNRPAYQGKNNAGKEGGNK